MKKIAILILCCMIVLGAFVLHALYADSTKVGTISGTPWLSSTPLPVSETDSILGSGAFVLSGTNTTAYYLGSGGSAATSVPCKTVTLALAGTGMVTSGGTSGMGFATSGGTNAWGSPLTLSATNLNTLAVTGTGQASYIYGN